MWLTNSTKSKSCDSNKWGNIFLCFHNKANTGLSLLNSSDGYTVLFYFVWFWLHLNVLVKSCHGPLVRYVKLWVAHATGIPGTFSPPPWVNDPDMHVPWCMPRSITSGFHWNRWRGKRSRHSRRMRDPKFYVSGKRVIYWFVVFRFTSLGLVWFSNASDGSPMATTPFN